MAARNFTKYSSTFSTGDERKFFHGEILGVGGPNSERAYFFSQVHLPSKIQNTMEALAKVAFDIVQTSKLDRLFSSRQVIDVFCVVSYPSSCYLLSLGRQSKMHVSSMTCLHHPVLWPHDLQRSFPRAKLRRQIL